MKKETTHHETTLKVVEVEGSGKRNGGRKIKDLEFYQEFDGKVFRVKWKAGTNDIETEEDARRLAESVHKAFRENLQKFIKKAKELNWDSDLIEALQKPDNISLRHEGKLRIYKDRGTKQNPRRVGVIIDVKKGKATLYAGR